jgi:UDP-N-acetylmuramoyl-tripeptide--D-alanyl-D-alanine ligase
MINLKEIINATKGMVVSTAKTTFSAISIDSRTIKDGELFIALKGDNFDGHDFVNDALKTGDGAIVNHNFKIKKLDKNKTIISVSDTLKALQDLARYIRTGFDIPVIGVVGSNGKTTTKEFISYILSTKLNVLKTLKNYNNHIGMPLSIVNYHSSPDVMVLEMGTNRPGDIKELCDIALPNIGIMTNIGYEHLAGFGSIEKVRDSEMEILDYVKTLVLNGDDEFLIAGVMEWLNRTKKGLEIIRYGIDKKDLDIVAKEIEISDKGSRFNLSIRDGLSILIELKIPGFFNIYNAIAAASLAYVMGFDLMNIKKGLESFNGLDMRFEIRKYDGVTYLNDVYNANPSSMKESINALVKILKNKRMNYKRAIVVLGDMLELGEFEKDEHIRLGKMLSDMPIDVFIGVGPLMSLATKEFKKQALSVTTPEEAASELLRIVKPYDIVLIKGSRGMRMERVLDSLMRVRGYCYAL